MNDYQLWRSLRELDENAGCAKGGAFRAFKRLLPELHEGQDFVVLDTQQQSTMVTTLQAEQRLYRSSVRPVLLSPQCAERVAAQLGVKLDK
jgi:hypothetical protein